MTDIVEELHCLYVWPQSVADNHADILTPRQIKMLYEVGNVAERAEAEITKLRAEVEALRGALGNLLLKAGEVRAMAEEFAPTLPSKTLWMRDVQMFKDAIEPARATLKGGDHG